DEVAANQIANSREAGHQLLARVCSSANRRLGNRALQTEESSSIVIGIELTGEVRMGIYKARQQCSITQIDDGGSGRDRAATDRLNFSIGDYNQAGLKQRTADAVEQPRCFDSPSCCLSIQNERKTQQDKGDP